MTEYRVPAASLVWTVHVLDEPCLQGREHWNFCQYRAAYTRVARRLADRFEPKYVVDSEEEQLIFENL